MDERALFISLAKANPELVRSMSALIIRDPASPIQKKCFFFVFFFESLQIAFPNKVLASTFCD